MQEISSSVSSMVQKVKAAAPKIETCSELLCPTCKKPLQIRGDAYCCPERHIYLNKLIAQRPVTIPEYKSLLTTGTTPTLTGFISKLGKPFSAKLKVNDKGYPEFDFGPKETPTENLTFGDWKVGVGEKCYLVEKKDLKFNVFKQIAQRTISIQDLEELLVKGKTQLLTNFISKANKPFSAFLVLKRGGKVEFEFEQRQKIGA